jgi:hypothetical protein
MTDPALFGGVFGGDSFAAWRALLAGFHGLALDHGEAVTFNSLTGRQNVPQSAFDELWLVMGRRGGKTHVSALLAVFEALFRDHRAKLSPGEVATVLVIAADRPQARTAMRYVRGLIEGNPMLAKMLTRETETTLEFSNRAAIEIGTASFRSVRGYTLAAVIADEIAFWHSDGANPDREIIQALRPALATLGGKLLALSSPYAKRGALWDAYRRSFANDVECRVLVAQAPTLTMNPSIAADVVERALADDPEAARAEYLAEFRSGIAAFLDAELLEGCMRPKPLELPPCTGITYHAFVDPAGGGADEFTLSIAHRENDEAVIDLVRGRRGSPADAVAEFAGVLKGYGIKRVTGDRYAGRWPRDEFQKHSIAYEVAEQDRSALYLELLAALNSGRVELPPCELTRRQLAGLERRTSRTGRDVIDHAPGGHDDRANAVAGAVAAMPMRYGKARLIQLLGV